MARHPTSGQFVIHHSAGVTRFSRVTRGIRHELDVFVDVDDPVKFSLLTLTNDGAAARTLSLFAYNDWVLGPPRESQAGHVIDDVRRDERDDPRAKRLQRRVRAARRVRACQRDAAFRDGPSSLVHRPQRFAVHGRRPCAT